MSQYPQDVQNVINDVDVKEYLLYMRKKMDAYHEELQMLSTILKQHGIQYIPNNNLGNRMLVN